MKLALISGIVAALAVSLSASAQTTFTVPSTATPTLEIALNPALSPSGSAGGLNLDCLDGLTPALAGTCERFLIPSAKAKLVELATPHSPATRAVPLPAAAAR